MKKAVEKFFGGFVCAVFVWGAYAFAHFSLQADDQTILIFALVLIWLDMTSSVNKHDAKSS